MLRLLFIFFTLLLLPTELVSQTPSKSSKYVRTPVLGNVDVFSLLYYAKIGLGTFDGTPSFRSYFLAIDTGSSLTWLQCEACQKPGNLCFPQLQPPFPNSKSHTYSPSTNCSSQNSRMTMSRRRRCIGQMGYESGEKTEFELAHEHFILETNVKKSLEGVKMEFGCGFKQTDFNEITKPGIMTGIMGLSRAKESFHFQIDTTESAKGVNFSYCFPILTKGGGPTTYLTFGKDIPSRSGFSVTPLLAIPGDDSYYVKMFDIIVNGHPLHIDPSYFDVGKYGGVIIDSGSSISILVQPVYDALERQLMAIFSAELGFHRKARNDTRMPPLCYDMPKGYGYKHLPRLEFVLQDATYVILPRQAFYVGKDAHHHRFFCLMMEPYEFSSVIGAYQQVNHRIVYDSSESKLFFKNENCAKDH